MPHAKTQTLIKQETSKAKEEHLQAAVLAYQTALKSNEIMSIRQVAQLFQVPRSTLQNCISGHKSRLEANAEKSWLTDEESKVLVDFLIKAAGQGFPDTKHHLRSQVNEIICEKLGDPSFSVGERWVDRWLEKWGKYLSKYWSTSLDTVCAKALNPEVVHDYFEKVKRVITEQNIEPDCLWTMDETSCLFGCAGKSMVIGKAGGHVQHSQRDGSHESATLMVLISAAGECPPPCIIFKGRNLNSIWSEPQNNPLGCL